MRYVACVVALVAMSISLGAQELKCTISINSEQVQGSNKAVFTTLQQSMEEFVNTQRWTNMTFQEKERIECSMMIVVKNVQDNMFVCEFTCQSRRPVFGTTYTTPTLNIKDENFTFTYQEYDRMEFQHNTFTSNLTALVAYYCYLIIGHDMDSFAKPPQYCAALCAALGRRRRRSAPLGGGGARPYTGRRGGGYAGRRLRGWGGLLRG